MKQFITDALFPQAFNEMAHPFIAFEPFEVLPQSLADIGRFIGIYFLYDRRGGFDEQRQQRARRWPCGSSTWWKLAQRANC